MPNIQVDLNNELIFCDCPGFKDTEGLEQEIINSFAIDYLFSTEGSNNQIKIVLVVSVYDLMATRQVHFLETLEQLNEMFPRINEMKKYICLIITKEDEEVSGIDLLEQIEENASHEMKIWIDYFRRNEHQVFTFPKAKISDVNNKYDFEDHDKLLHFLLCNYIRDPEHKIALSSQAFDRLEILKENQIKKIKEIISDFFSKLYDECDKCTDCESIELYISQIKNLSNSNIKNPGDFLNSIQKYLKNYECYEDTYLNLNESEAFNAFLDKLKNQNNIASTFENCFKNSFKKIINQLEKNLLHAKEMKNQKIENDECHKKNNSIRKKCL